jgi:hypothetical protein
VSDNLNLFIPLAKADAARRMIYGYATAEFPDRSGEICDYASTKPYYEQWSADFAKASGGRSFGNLRAMHGKVAAGKISAIAFNDEAKRIEIAAKIVDDEEWRKIEEGVYTGFSQGGAYVKRWQDPEQPEFMRYTASPAEISLVDLPCLPQATFELVKADGASEKRGFAEKPVETGAGSALGDWLTANVASETPAADLIAEFFAAIEKDFVANRALSDAATALLARLKSQCVAALQPRPAQKSAFSDSQFQKLAADNEAMRKIAADLGPRLTALAERVSALERAPAPPPLIPGFAPVSKSGDASLDDLAAEVARLSPENASLLMIKAAQAQPRRFG